MVDCRCRRHCDLAPANTRWPAGQCLLSVLGVNEDEDEGEGANKSYPLIAWARVSSAIRVCHNFSFTNLSIGYSTLSPDPSQSFW